MTYPNAKSSSMEFPLLACDISECSLDSGDSSSSSSTGIFSKKCFAILATVSVTLVLAALHCHYEQNDQLRHIREHLIKYQHLIYDSHDNNKDDVDNNDDKHGGYGVDASWPIHGPISRRHPGPFAEGSRHEAYLNHLEGCRKYYGQLSPALARVCDTYEYDRLLMNKRQPQSMENYTAVGFQKIPAPPRVAKLISDFWEANKEKQVNEVWPEGNIYLNHWESPSKMVSVDDTRLRGNGYGFKLQLWGAAQSTISEWTGGQQITPVSMYGIRVYTNGSLLVPHVDRLPLVSSAMINVAQDVDEPWPMEIYSHKDGKAHNVTLEPGEMLLFESHSVIHGRPFPLKGKYYAMLFMHFEPTGQNPLMEKESVEEQYRQAVQDGTGGQSSSESNSMLPPYIRRFSPEEEHWQRENPDGWRAPASNPASQYAAAAKTTTTAAAKAADDEGEDEDDAKTGQTKKRQARQQPEANQAAADGDLDFWKGALAKSAGSSEETYKLVNQRDSYGWQPIHESAINGREDIVELLLENGANINARTNGGRGGTPLFLAQQKLGPQHSIVLYLVDRGALSIPPDNIHRDEL